MNDIMPTIEKEIQQVNFRSPAHRTQVNIIYTAAWINQLTTSALREFGLSVQQFNILRILRGRNGKPATVKLLTERMIDKMSNASRLVDKLKEKGYVKRQECEEDRRRVDIVITKKGLDIVGRATAAVEQTMLDNFKTTSDDEFDQLSSMLDRLRG
jgi:DNA-binding MarR family transcriptional regulator